jgi:hypothetical protein
MVDPFLLGNCFHGIQGVQEAATNASLLRYSGIHCWNFAQTSPDIGSKCCALAPSRYTARASV